MALHIRFVMAAAHNTAREESQFTPTLQTLQVKQLFHLPKRSTNLYLHLLFPQQIRSGASDTTACLRKPWMGHQNHCLNPCDWIDLKHGRQKLAEAPAFFCRHRRREV